MNTTESPPTTAAPRRRRDVVVPHQLSFARRLLARGIFLGIRAVGLTLRYRWGDLDQRFPLPGHEPMIFCVWHNRLLLAPAIFHHFVRRREPGRLLAAVTSASKDGAVVARVLQHFRIEPVRGSSSRRGAQALLEAVRCARRGHDVALMPDGPRGPRYVIQDGVLALAQLSGLPILPISYRLHWKLQLKTWDRFQIPLPFARCDVVAGELIRVPREMNEERREELRQLVETQLRGLTVD